MAASIYSLEAFRDCMRGYVDLPPTCIRDRESRLLRRAKDLRLDNERLRARLFEITALPCPELMNSDEAKRFLQQAQEITHEPLQPPTTILAA